VIKIAMNSIFEELNYRSACKMFVGGLPPKLENGRLNP